MATPYERRKPARNGKVLYRNDGHDRERMNKAVEKRLRRLSTRTMNDAIASGRGSVAAYDYMQTAVSNAARLGYNFRM